jgi:outer membrane protein assembly factor BamB
MRLGLGLLALAFAACVVDEGDPERVGNLARPVAVDSCGAGPTVENGGFETGTLEGWTRGGKVAVIPRHHAGAFGARLARAIASAGHNAIKQAVHVPAAADGGSSLSFWLQPRCAGAPDYVAVEVRSPAGPRLATLMKECTSSTSWQQRSFDLAAWAGQDVVIRFDAWDDGVAETPSYAFLDDVKVLTEVAPPSVVITEPADGGNLPRRATVTASARTSACTGLDRVEFHRDGVLAATSSTSPASAEIDLGASGAHTILARAFDDLGGVAEWSVEVTSPCAGLPAWSLVHATAGPFPVTPVSGPNGLDGDGVPLLAAFLGLGDRLSARDARTGGDLGSFNPGAVIERPPLAVEIGSGAQATTYLFAAAADGHLYRQQMVGGLMVPAGDRDLRRPGCAADALTATPAVQLKAFSNPGYALAGDALVVVTHHQCGDHSQNQIIAFDPAAPMDSPPLWVFNQFGEHQLDYSLGGCAVDYALNRLYCATHQEPLSSQPTLWALDVNTGDPVWARNTGSLHNRPVLDPVARRLFVASVPGALSALDPDSPAGSTVWGPILVASTGTTIERDIWADTRGVVADRLFVVDTGGTLRAVNDASGSLLWAVAPSSGELFTSEPSVTVDASGGTARLYLGTDAGRILELEYGASSASIVGWRAASESSETTAGALLLSNAVVGNTATQAKRFCAPFLNGAPY